MSPEQAKVIYRGMEEQGEHLNRAELQRGFNRYEALRKLNVRQFSELNRRNLAGERFDDMVDALVAGEPLAKQQESAPVLPEIPLLRTGLVQIRDFTLKEMQDYAISAVEATRAADRLANVAAIAAGGAK